MQIMKRIRQAGTSALAFALVAVSGAAHAASPNASGSGMPWEGPIDKILASIQGPVARAFLLIAIIVTGLMMAFGEHGSGFKKVMGIAFGGSIVVMVVSFVSSLFGATF
ncbi:MAG: TrbC/VirB2 family protein [Noviherbaspirillum sp.]